MSTQPRLCLMSQATAPPERVRFHERTPSPCSSRSGAVGRAMPRIAFYAGSFDPVTNGHLDVVRQAVMLCDRLIVAIGINPGKKPLFSVEERLAMIKDVFGPVGAKAGCTIE